MSVEIDKFLQSLNAEYLPRARKAMAKAINEYASFVIGEAVPLAPRKTGFLQASWAMEPASEGKLNATIGFNADYALFVHENLTAKHSQGQAKFLEIPCAQAAGGFSPFVLKKLQEEFA